MNESSGRKWVVPEERSGTPFYSVGGEETIRRIIPPSRPSVHRKRHRAAREPRILRKTQLTTRTKLTTRAAAAGTLVALASTLAGPALAQDAAVTASAQAPGTAVTVDMPAAGFLVIHAFDGEGNPIVPALIGHVAVPAGASENVEVEIGIQTEAGMKVLAMLHEDTGIEGVYEFGPGSTDADVPLTADGKPVVAPIAIE